MENLQKEITENMVSVYKQLGLPKPKVRFSDRYQFEVNSLGTKNIDRFVVNQTISRESGSITINGETAKITYLPLSVTVKDENNFDFTQVYLTTNKLASYMKIKKEDNSYKEKLNDIIDYNLVVITYKDEQGFIYAQKDIKGNQSLKIQLEQKSKAELNKIVREHSKNIETKDIKNDLEHQRFLILDQARKQKNAKITELDLQLRPVIFPCISEHAVMAGDTLQVAPSELSSE